MDVEATVNERCETDMRVFDRCCDLSAEINADRRFVRARGCRGIFRNLWVRALGGVPCAGANSGLAPPSLRPRTRRLPYSGPKAIGSIQDVIRLFVRRPLG
jgi:hypothetical protein